MALIAEVVEGAVAGGVKALKKKGVPRGRKSSRKTHPQADKIAAALTALRKSSAGDDLPAQAFREELFAELRKLIKPAVSQARKGKPALLRILARYSK